MCTFILPYDRINASILENRSATNNADELFKLVLKDSRGHFDPRTVQMHIDDVLNGSTLTCPLCRSLYVSHETEVVHGGFHGYDEVSYEEHYFLCRSCEFDYVDSFLSVKNLNNLEEKYVTGYYSID